MGGPVIYLTTGPIAIASKNQWLPVLQRAVDDADGRWSTEELLNDVADGRLMVWIVKSGEKVRGVFTTRFLKSHVYWISVEDCAGDDLASWIFEALHALETWAREMGASQILLEGRRGWERVLRPYGFNPTRTVCVKDLHSLN